MRVAMKGLPLLALAVVSANAVEAWDIPPSHAIHEKRDALPKRWNKGSRLAADHPLPLRIGLKQSNMDDAHAALMDVSHPSSPNYGKHWTAEQVIDFFKPSESTIASVTNWILEAGFTNVTLSDNKAWLAFSATASEAERLLHTEFHVYHDVVSGKSTESCDLYHLPKKIQEHVDYVKPGIQLRVADPPLQRRRNGWQSKPGQWPGQWPNHPPPKFHKPHWTHPPHYGNVSNCDVEITPACVAALYDIPPSRGPVSAQNSLGIYESELQFWNQQDLDLFFANFTPYIPAGTHPINVEIDGGVAETTNISLAGGEAELDLMLAYPIVYPQSITVFNEDDLVVQSDPNDTYTGGFNTFLDAIDGSYCTYSAYGETGDDPDVDPVYPDPAPGGYKGQLQCGVYSPTNVISVSYGGQEADVPKNYQMRQCNEFLKLGLQGVSILFASGDSGVSNYPEPYGTDGPTGCLGPDLNIFNPTWPNTCPYITNVGATKVYPGKTVFDPESAVFDPAGHPYHVNYSSGGGFSNIYPIPDYQQAAVNSFFAEYNPPYPYYSGFVNDTSKVGYEGASSSGGIYNRIGRGVPDVAANGDNIAVYVGGEFGLSGGTSASTPIFASIVNRIVEERLAIGKGPVGFINPTLYQNPWVLNDIVNGSNPGCGTIGFSAVPGWDPVTGLGTPNFPRMLKLFLELP